MKEQADDWKDELSPDDDDAQRDPVEELAADFAERYRQGEDVTIEEYAAKYPELAAEIEDLFPTIAAMERFNTARTVEAAMLDRSKPKQLGDYRIIEEIARGGMGIVYEAEQLSLGRRVAVKALSSHTLSRKKDVQRFQREAHTAAKLHHSNIVPIIGIGEEAGQHYIVMQLIRGVGLDEVLNEIRRVFVGDVYGTDGASSVERIRAVVKSASNLVEGDWKLAASTSVAAQEDTVEVPREGVPTPQACPAVVVNAALGSDFYRNVAKIGLQAADAIQHAHEHNTLHRDIKPGNLILDGDGRVWVADFGLAKAVQDDDVTRSGDIVGTIAYVAPERFQGTTTPASDIYSLGVTLHEMLTLQKAFVGTDRVEVFKQVTTQGLPKPRRLNPKVPRDLETIVMKAAAVDPNDRYASAGALAHDLEAFLEDRPISARPLSHFEHGWRWCRRNRSLAAMAVSVVCLIATVIGLLAYGYRHAEHQRAIAQRTADRAISAMNEIFSHFAPTSLASTVDTEDIVQDPADEDLPGAIPISRDTALLLENLLDFYDDFAAESADSEAAAIQAVSANRRVGDIHRRLDQLEDAKLAYEEAITRIQRLPPSLRDTKAMRLEAARTYNGLGLTLVFSWGAMRERTHAHRTAVEVLGREDGSPEERLELAKTLYFLHQAEDREQRWSRRGRKDRHPNSKSLTAAREILQQLREETGSNPEVDLLLARCLLVDRSGDKASRHQSQRTGMEMLARLAQEHPENPDYLFALGIASIDLHRSQEHRRNTLEDTAENERRLRRALSATEDLEIRHPNIPRYYQLKKDLSESLGKVLWNRNAMTEAVGLYGRAVQMQRLLIAHAEHPRFHRPWLYYVQVDYGQILLQAEEFGPAREVLLEAVAGLEELLDESPSGERSRRRWFSANRRKLQSAYQALAELATERDDADLAKEWHIKSEALNTSP